MCRGEGDFNVLSRSIAIPASDDWHPDRKPSNSARIGSAVLGTLILLAALFYLFTALCAIKNFAWRQPMFDQWRMYQSLLTVPFPQNILVSENGHHPIIPNAIRYAEARWFSANQLLQISIGISCAFLCVCIVSYTGWRERRFGFAGRAAVALLAVLGIFWLANARILMHGNEALHAYLLVLSVIVAAVCTHRAAQGNANRWLVAASAACAVAMFCFGPGVASFPAVIVLGLLLRIPLRHLLIPAGALVVLLAIYLFALPGDDGVRGMLSLQPWESAKIAMTWISSPWATEWLGWADPPLAPQMIADFNEKGRWLWMTASANALVNATGLPWQTLSMLIGFIGTLYFIAHTLYVFTTKRALTRLQSLATMLCLFGLSTSAVISIGRFDYFHQFPGQVFADRYLIWPCLFWCGLALMLLSDVYIARARWPRAMFLCALLALPLCLFPMHEHTTGWASVVYNQGQSLAASARSGVIDTALADATTDGVDVYKRGVAIIKEHRLAMFADPSWKMMGQVWSNPIQSSPDIGVDAYWMETFQSDAKPVRHVRGVVRRGISKLQGGNIALLDASNRIVGFGEISSVGKGRSALLMSTPRKRGFDGYVVDADPSARYRVVWLRPDRNEALFLADLPPG